MANVGSHIGTAPLGEEVNGVNFSESWLSLSPSADYPKDLAQVRAVASSYPGAFSDVQTYLHERIDEVLTNGTTDDVVVRVYGTGLGELARWATSSPRCWPGFPGCPTSTRPHSTSSPRSPCRSTWLPPAATG